MREEHQLLVSERYTIIDWNLPPAALHEREIERDRERERERERERKIERYDTCM